MLRSTLQRLCYNRLSCRFSCPRLIRPNTRFFSAAGVKEQSITATEPSPTDSFRCVAYCTAEKYDLKALDRLFHGNQRPPVHKVIPYVHVSNPFNTEGVDVFFFPYGSFVSWGSTKEVDQMILQKLQTLAAAPVTESPIVYPEVEEYTWRIGPNLEIDTKRDSIVLKRNDPKSKLGFSFGLAASVKLNINEEITDSLMQQMGDLFSGRRVQQENLVRRLELLYQVRNTNLIISEQPDYFWEHPQEEKLLEMAHAYCSTKARVQQINEKVEHFQDLLDTLKDDIKHRQSLRLERVIVALILIEVIFGLIDHQDLFISILGSTPTSPPTTSA